MKILFITNNFPPIIDGVGDYTYLLSKELQKHGHHIHILCSKNKDIIRHSSHFVNEGIQVYPLIEKWNRKAINTAYQKIMILKPNWVSLQYVPYGFNKYGIPLWITLLIMKLSVKGIKTITTAHELYLWRKDEITCKNYPIHLLQKALGHIIFSNSTHIITSIDFYEKKLKRYKSKTTRIPIGSNIIQPTSDISNVQQKLKHKYAPNNEKILVLFGQRNHEVLLEAQQILYNNGIAAKILIIGKQKSEQKNTKEIIYTGILDNNGIYNHLMIADLFVLPETISKNAEGGACLKSGSLAAAFMCGIPIITTKGNLSGSELRHAENIYFISAYNAYSFASSIEDLLINKNLRSKISNNAKEFYNKSLSWKTIAEGYNSIINN